MREKGTQPCLSCLMLAALCFQSHEREKKPPLPPRSRDSSKSGPRKALSENTQRDKVWVLLTPVDKGNCSLHGDITWHNQALREFYTTEMVQLVRWHASFTQCRQALSWTDWRFLAKETAVCVKTSKFCSTVSSPESSEWCWVMFHLTSSGHEREMEWSISQDVTRNERWSDWQVSLDVVRPSETDWEVSFNVSRPWGMNGMTDSFQQRKWCRWCPDRQVSQDVIKLWDTEW